MTLDELIAKLEAATEGSEALDLEIARMIKPEGIFQQATLLGPTGKVLHQGGYDRTYWNWSQSIEMALTLIPDGKGWNVGGYGGKYPQYKATVYGRDAASKSSALAICIAALKAQQAQS